MKYRSGILFLSVLICLLALPCKSRSADSVSDNTAGLQEIWLENDEYNVNALLEAELSYSNYDRSRDLDNLIKAKFQFINGDLKLAKFYLNQIDENTSRVSEIKNRYLAIIAFIEGKFDRSIAYLKITKKNLNSNSPHSCLLKLINYMAINDVESLKREELECRLSSKKYSKNDQYWLDTMIKLKLKDTQGLKKNLLTDVDSTLSDDEMAKLWLKTGLFINKESDLLSILSELPENSYQSKRLREIVAFMYLRTGLVEDRKKALSFIDDIESANAENIKGNINLQNKEYDLAFGHFQLALRKKQDSTNSLERAIPLAWLLNQSKDGLNMIESDTNSSLDPRNKKAIRIAFLIKEKKMKEAQNELLLLKADFKNQPPFEVSIMDSYIETILGDKNKKYDKRMAEDATEKACRAYDGISCWISLQFIQWENIGKTIKRDESLFSDKDMTIDSLKEQVALNPLKENIIVDQKDIEELDNAEISLIKK